VTSNGSCPGLPKSPTTAVRRRKTNKHNTTPTQKARWGLFYVYGYQEALSRHKLELDKSLVKHGQFDYESGYELGQELLTQGSDFTAVFASNDLMAIGCMTALQDNGISIPHDISVVGFDDIDLAFFVRPKLSTVYQPNYEMGAAAVRLIMERLRRERNVKTRQELTTRLVIRESMTTRAS